MEKILRKALIRSGKIIEQTLYNLRLYTPKIDTASAPKTVLLECTLVKIGSTVKVT